MLLLRVHQAAPLQRQLVCLVVGPLRMLLLQLDGTMKRQQMPDLGLLGLLLQRPHLE